MCGFVCGEGFHTPGNSNRLLQMDVFQKCIYPCIMNVKHASWTPV